MWVMHVPVISTWHLTEDTANAHITVDNEGPGGLYSVSFPQGYMVYCDDLVEIEEGDEIPADLRVVLKWALAHGYDWVRFDADGSTVEELPTYEW